MREKQGKIEAVLALMIVALAAPVCPVRAADRIRVAGTAVATPAGEVVREIDDPHTGDRWLLVRDGARPGGPGRLVLAERMALSVVSRKASSSAEKRLPVVRNGDRVVIEEETPVLSARIEAVALGTVAQGGLFNARLTAGGKVVRAVALGPGRAAFARDQEQRP